AGNRRGRSDDGVLRERPDRSRPFDAGAVLPGAPDEAAVPRELPGIVRDLRHEPEPRDVLVQAGMGRPAARRPAGAEREESKTLEPRTSNLEPRTSRRTRCRIQNDDIPKRARPSAGPTTR